MPDAEPTDLTQPVPPPATRAWQRVAAELAAGREDAARQAADEAMAASDWDCYDLCQSVVTVEYRMSELIPRGWVYYAYENDGWDELFLLHPDAMLFLIDHDNDAVLSQAAQAAGAGLLRFDTLMAATL